jgi:HD-GYP domain-containing protein (c-di-GMP phosphodiesterase class II)
MNAIAAPSETVNCATGFVSVPIHTIRALRADTADLYVQYVPSQEPTLYCRAGSHPDQQQFTELAGSGVECLYVSSDDFSNFSNNLLTSLESILDKEHLKIPEKFVALQLAVAIAVEQTLRLVDCNKFRKLAQKVGDDLVALFGDGATLPREIFKLARHDVNTFTHITNVASYSVILARKFGIKDDHQLRQIATGAMLHDVGKRFIPPRLLNKQERLTEEERQIVESHPARGYLELCEKGDVDFGQLMMVYQHHERPDGTGYPVGVFKDEIHLWARLLSVVNVFDKLTAKRPDRHPHSAEDALNCLRKQSGTQFDPEFVECWISAMSKA